MSGEWIAQLPDDLKTNEALTGYKTLGDFAKAHLEIQGKLSEFDGKTKDFEGKIVDLEKRLGESIPKLSDNATPDEIKAFNKAMGVPDTPDGYKFEKPKDLPQGLDYQDAVVQWWAQIAHKTGLSDKTAKAIFDEYNKLAIEEFKKQAANYEAAEKEAVEQANKKNEEAHKALRVKWGDEYDKNCELAVRCIKHFGGEKFGEKIIAKGLENDPDVIEFMVAVASAFKDDTLADLTMTPPQKGDLKPGQLQFSYPSMG